ncbi:MAG: AzlD domain-containing protein [Clostridiales bacterium]|nr:AzlD domain-containing protein [Clostridiales bacterium]
MTVKIMLYIAIMAGVTYFIRVVPMMAFRKKIKSQFVKSFLFYVPYAVLGAMTFPAIFYSTGSVISASAGFAIAVVLAFFGKSLIIVACAASGLAFIAELILKRL